MGLEREIDSDRLRAIFTPAGRLRRPNRMRFVELESSPSSGHTTNKKGAPVGRFGFLWVWREIDQNSLWAVLTLRAPAASKTLARFVELEFSSASRHPTNEKGAPLGPLFR